MKPKESLSNNDEMIESSKQGSSKTEDHGQATKANETNGVPAPENVTQSSAAETATNGTGSHSESHVRKASKKSKRRRKKSAADKQTGGKPANTKDSSDVNIKKEIEDTPPEKHPEDSSVNKTAVGSLKTDEETVVNKELVIANNVTGTEVLPPAHEPVASSSSKEEETSVGELASSNKDTDIVNEIKGVESEPGEKNPTLNINVDEDVKGSPKTDNEDLTESNTRPNCLKHPDQPILGISEIMQRIKSGEFVPRDVEKNPKSLLCGPCSFVVVSYFNVIKDFLGEVLGDLVGLQAYHKCIGCVTEEIGEMLSRKRSTDAPHLSRADGIGRRDDVGQRDIRSEDDNKDDTAQKEDKSVKKDDHGRDTGEKTVSESTVSDASYLCPFANRQAFKNVDSTFRPSNTSSGAQISPADHSRCNPLECHIKRWYCPHQPESHSVAKPEPKSVVEPSSPGAGLRKSSTSPFQPILPPLISPVTPVAIVRPEMSDASTQLNELLDEHEIAPTSPEPRTENINEAYVTLATSDLSAMGCLVLGHSIGLTRTGRTLAVIVTDNVSAAVRELLSTIYHEIYPAVDFELSLLNDDDFGMSFTKLYAWKLTQYTKAVFLECDTFMLQNCDELFERSELSAVPDIGWPDCFNSSVFVFVPSDYTYRQLIQQAQSNHTIEGGEQGLLNAHFKDSWSKNISCRLPFIYNLMANVSYTYAPAFKQFGKHAKIVHFLGAYKPWNIQWSPVSGRITPAAVASIHKSYYSFIHAWITIFIHYVIPSLSPELQLMIRSFYSMTVRDLIKMYQHTTDDISDIIPTNPSMRVRIDEEVDNPRLQLHHFNFDGKSEESKYESEKVDEIRGQECQIELIKEEKEDMVKDEAIDHEATTEPEELMEKAEEESKLPNYDRMHMWETGHIDYAGVDASNKLMSKLDSMINN